MILDTLLFFFYFVLDRDTFCLDSGDLILLCIDLAFPFALHGTHLYVLGSELFFKRKEFLLKLAVLLLDLVDVLL